MSERVWKVSTPHYHTMHLHSHNCLLTRLTHSRTLPGTHIPSPLTPSPLHALTPHKLLPSTLSPLHAPTPHKLLPSTPSPLHTLTTPHPHPSTPSHQVAILEQHLSDKTAAAQIHVSELSRLRNALGAERERAAVARHGLVEEGEVEVAHVRALFERQNLELRRQADEATCTRDEVDREVGRLRGALIGGRGRGWGRRGRYSLRY